MRLTKSPVCILSISLILSTFLCTASAYAEQEKKKRNLYIAAQMSYSNERMLFNQLFRDFERKNPGIEVHARFFRGDYTKQLDLWLNQGSGPDVFFWYADRHIDRIAEKGLFKDLSEFWRKHKLHKVFDPGTREAVRHRGKEYGIPIAQYPWALYYRPSLFEDLDIPVPTTWEQLLRDCNQVYRAQKRSLIALGSKETWALNAWIDYFNLRLHGMSFYRSLLEGPEPWSSPELLQSLKHWKEMIEHNCFNIDTHQDFSVDGLLPRLYHRQSLMALLGGYIVGDLPELIKYDFRPQSFPIINSKIPSHTISPIDAFTVAHYTEMSEELETLLLYLSSSFFQSTLNGPSSRLPANANSRRFPTSSLQAHAAEIINAADITGFMDRDSHPLLALKISQDLQNFLNHRDPARAQKELAKTAHEFFAEYSLPAH